MPIDLQAEAGHAQHMRKTTQQHDPTNCRLAENRRESTWPIIQETFMTQPYQQLFRTLTAAILLATTTPSYPKTDTQGREIPNIGIAIGQLYPDSSKVYWVNAALAAYVPTLNGVQLGALTSMTNTGMSGLNIGSVMAYGGNESCGVQLGGAANISNGTFGGVMLSAVVNVANRIDGVQLSPFNFASEVHGLQMGLLNVLGNGQKGWQVGVVNFSRDGLARQIGLVNATPSTTIDVLAFGGNTSKLNAALRFRNRNTYVTFGSGVYYMGFDERFSGALFYRIGRYIPLSRRWILSADLGYYHIEAAKEHSREKPTRLRSLQVHANLDYQISRTLGAFLSTGYGEARRYGSNELFRRRLLLEGGLAVRWKHPAERPLPTLENEVNSWATDENRQAQMPLFALGNDTLDTRFRYNEWAYRKKRPWLAAAEATGINVLVHSFDRFLLGEDFAKVTFKSIGHNFRYGFVWDNDKFSTNLFAHPYHGNLYFNAARSNGLGFWASAPYALGGSLMWEFMGEIEPPAINDLMATTMGGIAIGEVMHRVSALILNDKSRGMRRFLREFAATVVNPMQGLKRITSGDAWRVRNQYALYHDYQRQPVELTLAAGTRYLADDGGLFRGEQAPYIDLFLEYGDAFNDNTRQPYDYFLANINFSLSPNQPIINRLHLLGKLWSAPVYQGKNAETVFGIFQHFNYYDSEPVKDGTSLTPYRISEAAAVGPGMLFRANNLGNSLRIEQRVFVAGILLGGTKSDYYNIIDRDYNMGSGYSVKSNTLLTAQNGNEFAVNVDYYRLFTWKGYEGKDLAAIDPLHLNSQGDKGDAQLLVVNPRALFALKRGLGIQTGVSYYMRRTRYRHYDNVRARTFEARAGLVYRF